MTISPFDSSEDDFGLVTVDGFDLYENINTTGLYLGSAINGSFEDEKIICTPFSQSPSHAWSEVFEGVLSDVVGIIGLMGNVCAICILRRDEFRETFHKLLISLCVFDSLFIVCALMIYAFRAHRLFLINSSIIHYLFVIFYPTGNISLYGSIYTTLAISLERYRGITYPIRSRTEPKRKLIKYIVPVLLLSVGFNLPKCFESALVEMKDSNNKTTMVAGDTWLSRNIAYTHYYKVWSHLILTTIIPLAVLTFCNGSIVLTLRRNKDIRRRSSAASSRIKQEFALSMTLIGIVVVFVVCHAFRFFLAFYQVSVTKRTVQCLSEEGLIARQPEWLYAITAVSHFMLMLNSSVNFIVYCAFGTRFRKALPLTSVYRLFTYSSSRDKSNKSSTTWKNTQEPNIAPNRKDGNTSSETSDPFGNEKKESDNKERIILERVSVEPHKRNRTFLQNKGSQTNFKRLTKSQNRKQSITILKDLNTIEISEL